MAVAEAPAAAGKKKRRKKAKKVAAAAALVSFQRRLLDRLRAMTKPPAVAEAAGTGVFFAATASLPMLLRCALCQCNRRSNLLIWPTPQASGAL